jgi:hypothetical protein
MTPLSLGKWVSMLSVSLILSFAALYGIIEWIAAIFPKNTNGFGIYIIICQMKLIFAIKQAVCHETKDGGCKYKAALMPVAIFPAGW